MFCEQLEFQINFRCVMFTAFKEPAFAGEIMAVLSNLQLELLRLYGNNVSDETLHEVKSILAKYFADKATDAMDKVWEEKNLTAQDMINWTNEHNRAENRP
jgi:hypothetical protein